MKYRDRVLITGGFFGGNTGIVVSSPLEVEEDRRFYVRLDNPEPESKAVVEICDGYLEIIDDIITDNPAFDNQRDLFDP